MIRTIVFDFGNVVGYFDHRPTLERLAPHTPLSVAELQRRLYGGDLEIRYESGQLDTAAFLQKVRHHCRLRCSDEVIAAAWVDIFRPNLDVGELIAQLKNHYRLLLLSNTNELHARRFRRQFAEVLQHFEALVLSYKIGHRKPEPEVFEHCRRLAGCAAEECLFIDDLPANVAGALAVGWHGMVYRDIVGLRRDLQALGVALSLS